MSEKAITLTIGEDSITQLVRARIEAELLHALSRDGGAEKLLAGMVSAALQAKVTRNYRDVPFIQDLVSEAIQKETRLALSAWLDENRDAIRKAMLAAIKADKSLPVRILTNLMEAASSEYRMSVTIAPTPGKE